MLVVDSKWRQLHFFIVNTDSFYFLCNVERIEEERGLSAEIAVRSAKEKLTEAD